MGEVTDVIHMSLLMYACLELDEEGKRSKLTDDNTRDPFWSRSQISNHDGLTRYKVPMLGMLIVVRNLLCLLLANTTFVVRLKKVETGAKLTL